MSQVNAADLVHQLSTSTGTGNFTLSTVNGKQSFDTAFSHGATTDVFPYYISNRDAAEYEWGTGHMSDATTLVRDTVLGGTNGTSKVNFSAGSKDVTNDIPAARQGAVIRVVRKQVFTASGTYTPSAGMVYCDLECIGGGGGGAGVAGASGQGLNACGGGGGEYAIRTVTAATIGASQSVTVGAGGSGGAAGNNDGSGGGDTSVGTVCIAKGGAGATSRAGTNLPGAGGTGGTADFKTQGQAGGQAISYGAATQGQSGPGGASGSGFGFGGVFVFSGTGATAGTNGGSYGGGGSGAGSFNSTATAGGGNGALGAVIITEYCTQ